MVRAARRGKRDHDGERIKKESVEEEDQNSSINSGNADTTNNNKGVEEERKSQDSPHDETITTTTTVSISNSDDANKSSDSTSNNSSSRKRSRGASAEGNDSSNNSNNNNSNNAKAANLTAATIAAVFSSICQLDQQHGNSGGGCLLPALQPILTSLAHNNAGTANVDATSVIEKLQTIKAAAHKAVLEAPPYVHLSARDSAPQLKMDDSRLILNHQNQSSTSGSNTSSNNAANTNSAFIMRGYRMSRASHGVSSGLSYYECTILDPITCPAPSTENYTLGSVLQQAIQNQEPNNGGKNVTMIGHTRIGWSMRTAELQAPVGYDQWSYGLRDISGSKIHNSKRDDRWGGFSFGPGDIVGFAIFLLPSKDNNYQNTQLTNHIRFFKNGEPMGQFIISKGIRTGGAAFDNIQPGTYYPAVSIYMGASVKVNFGPHFVYPPRKLLPLINKLISSSSHKVTVQPISELCPAPPDAQTLWDEYIKWEKKHPNSSNNSNNTKMKKLDENIVKAFRKAVFTEANIRYEHYQSFVSQHLQDVRAARQQRNLSINDLPPIETDKTLSPEV